MRSTNKYLYYITSFIKNHKYLWVLSYFVIYMIWFAYVERANTKGYHLIHVSLDDIIPFCEWFIIPYILWFGYVFVTVAHTALFNRREFVRLFTFLCIGMTIFLIISTVYPNGHHLRPVIRETDNIALMLCRKLYSVDTSTNIFPSIHVYNSIACHAAVIHCKEFKDKPFIRYGSLILCISIILSTMFLKQHSVFDVATAILLSCICYRLIYSMDILNNLQHHNNTIQHKHA